MSYEVGPTTGEASRVSDYTIDEAAVYFAGNRPDLISDRSVSQNWRQYLSGIPASIDQSIAELNQVPNQPGLNMVLAKLRDESAVPDVPYQIHNTMMEYLSVMVPSEWQATQRHFGLEPKPTTLPVHALGQLGDSALRAGLTLAGGADRAAARVTQKLGQRLGYEDLTPEAVIDRYITETVMLGDLMLSEKTLKVLSHFNLVVPRLEQAVCRRRGKAVLEKLIKGDLVIHDRAPQLQKAVGIATKYLSKGLRAVPDSPDQTILRQRIDNLSGHLDYLRYDWRLIDSIWQMRHP